MKGSKIPSLAVPVLGGLLVPIALAGTTAAATASTRRTTSHRHVGAQRVHRRHVGIPQHNGGDRDSDNNGAPSDGDGNQ